MCPVDASGEEEGEEDKKDGATAAAAAGGEGQDKEEGSKDDDSHSNGEEWDSKSGQFRPIASTSKLSNSLVTLLCRKLNKMRLTVK